MAIPNNTGDAKKEETEGLKDGPATSPTYFHLENKLNPSPTAPASQGGTAKSGEIQQPVKITLPPPPVPRAPLEVRPPSKIPMQVPVQVPQIKIMPPVSAPLPRPRPVPIVPPQGALSGAPSPQAQSWGAVISIIIIVLMIIIGAFYAWGQRIAQNQAFLNASSTAQ